MTGELILEEAKSLSPDDKVWLAELLRLDADNASKEAVWDAQALALKRRPKVLDRERMHASGRDASEVLAELRQKRAGRRSRNEIDRHHTSGSRRAAQRRGAGTARRPPLNCLKR